MNKITISLKEYDSLREFKKAKLEGKSFGIIKHYGYGTFEAIQYYSEDELSKELAGRIEKYLDKIEKLDDKINELEETIYHKNSEYSNLIREIASWSILEFIRMRKFYKRFNPWA